MVITVTNRIAGRSIGTVTWRNSWRPLAPSTRAASYRCGSTVCNAARKITIALPMLRQTPSAMIDGIVVFGFPSQSGPVMPTCASAALMMPTSGSSM